MQPVVHMIRIKVLLVSFMFLGIICFFCITFGFFLAKLSLYLFVLAKLTFNSFEHVVKFKIMLKNRNNLL